jgi:hypothetical protein
VTVGKLAQALELEFDELYDAIAVFQDAEATA